MAMTLTQASAAGRFLGEEFPDFSARDAITGEPFTLRDLRGSVVLVDFWASWCGPCRRELPHVKRAYEKYRDQGFEIVGISLDSSENRFRSFVRSNEMDWHHVMEGEGWRTRLALQYGVNSIPRMYLLDANGVCIAERVRGRALEAAVQRGLSAVAAVPDEVPALLLDSPAAARLWNRLEIASKETERSADPLRRLSVRLSLIADALSRGDPQRHWEELYRIRHTLFMMGLLDGRYPVTLPQEAPALRAAIERMRQECEQATRQLARQQQQIGRLKRDLVDAAEATVELEARINDAHDHALLVAESWCEPWLDQVDAAQAMIAGLRRPLAEHQARLQALERRITAVRGGASRESAASVYADVSAALGGLADLGIIDVDQPGAPQAGLRQAAETLDGARRRVDYHQRHLQALAAEASAIRSELSERLEAGGDLDELRNRFSDLARETLASQDRLLSG
jgi:thiol-disulfide isomerase/thioredoxin